MDNYLQLKNLSMEIDFIENCIETSANSVDLLQLQERLEVIVAQLQKLEKLERIEKLGLRLIICQ
jgi:hypothetical protein